MPDSTMNTPKEFNFFKIPAGFKELLEVFASNVQGEQPKDIQHYITAFIEEGKRKQYKREQEVKNQDDAKRLMTTRSEAERRSSSSGSTSSTKEVRQTFV